MNELVETKANNGAQYVVDESGKRYRYMLGFDALEGNVLVEDPEWMTETRLRRLFRPIAKIVNVVQYEPFRDGLWPNGDPNSHGGAVGYGGPPVSGGAMNAMIIMEKAELEGRQLTKKEIKAIRGFLNQAVGS